jgi:RHS repeat-associated protein
VNKNKNHSPAESVSRDKDSFSVSAPNISLPKGGGAVRGIGEKFAANPVTGTGSMSAPIATSPGRAGFGPQLSLSYDSGAGNGPFGLGWNLSLPSITRKTDKGLPKYQDADESDVFILSGAEDLVPVLQLDAAGNVVPGPDGRPQFVEDTRNGYRVRRYRPRIEGLFARIEKWTALDGSQAFWRSISKDNITTWYGKAEESRIADPADATRIFSWLICESCDDKGNAMRYQYKGDNVDRVNLSAANERNRSRTAQRYLKRIKYGNKTPHRRDAELSQHPDNDWMFEVVFDYGEHYIESGGTGDDQSQPTTVRIDDRQQQWAIRQDPFSSYRSGFEVRTYRLCQRVLMFHHFPGELGRDDYLVRATHFNYRPGPSASFISAVTQSGYLWQTATNTYVKKSLPPVEFEYSAATINETVREVDAGSLENIPYGLDGANYQWVDLDGEGLSGILTEQGGAWFYKRNLGAVPISAPYETPPRYAARFAPIERLPTMPSPARLSGGQQLLDLAGDGQLDVVEFDGPATGFFERTHDEGWETFTLFKSLPNVEWKDPNLKFVDLTGDGHADILITENEVFTWYPSLAEEGFGPAEKTRQPFDEEAGPRLVFADGTQSIYLSDLSGDGLTDLVRIRNGEVCYWPNLGYGRFGKKVTMDNAPWFDAPDQFDQKRIRLADIDGSGTVDILYLGRDGVDLFFNNAGNSWAPARKLSTFPRADNLSSVMATDLFGNGTACLVWSSPLPGDARRPMRYIDLMGGQKPHLLIKTINNLGAETRVQYASSTKFYLEDKRDGKPWITKLPFPVHVVAHVQTYDHVSRNRFVTRYAYHHGYFDGEEREFRGFGMVEQFDTEKFSALSESDVFPIGNNIDVTSHVPPVHTKTWFHTGVYLGRDRVSNYFAGLLDTRDVGEYYPRSRTGDAAADAAAKVLLLDDTVLPTGLTLDEEREACRALKGTMLRQEVYALDDTLKEPHPYTVVEQNFTIRRLQPRVKIRHAVFFTHPREAITYHYERNPNDPRTQHAITLEVDDYGNVCKQAAIGYGRRPGLSSLQGEDKKKQEQPLITYTQNGFTNEIEDSDDHRTPLPAEARTYEVTGLRAATDTSRFGFEEIAGECNAAALLDYEKAPTSGRKEKRLIEHVRTLYRRNDLTSLLPLDVLEPLALPGESYKLAFPPGLAQQIYIDSGKLAAAELDAVLANEGRYVHVAGDANWWIPAGRVFLSPNSNDNAAEELGYASSHFFLPQRMRDPFHTNAISTESFVDYDVYDLLMVETRDALGNRITVDANNYRVLQPRLVSDPNRNQTVVAFDVLGMVVGTAVMGKPGENLGDVLDGFVPDLSEAVILSHLANPLTDPHAILGRATTRLVYDLFAYHRSKALPDPQPAVVYTLVRETHDADLARGQQTKIQHSFSYSDGFGREIQKKIQAEPEKIDGVVGLPRWVGSGWTIFNNKGKPVRQYEPFFSATHRFEYGLQVGVSPVLFYDPVERVVATLHPNHTYEKVVFDPWQQATYDVNDTVAPRNAQTGDPRTDPDIRGYVAEYFKALPVDPLNPWETWYQQRQAGALGLEEQAAASKAAAHADTPTTAHFDALGRPFLTLASNRVVCANHALDGMQEQFATRIELDIEGNQRTVRDANKKSRNAQGNEVIDELGRIVMRYAYDMLGNRIHQLSMEAGARWMLNDVAGKPIRAWDSRGHNFVTAYDALRRPVEQYVRGTTSESDPRTLNRDILVDKIEYGEPPANASQAELDRALRLNLRTRIYRHFDSAGVATNAQLDTNGNPTAAYDFKGNLLRSTRKLVSDYQNIPDWSLVPQPTLDDETFTSSTRYDALNRPVQSIAPHSSLARATLNIIQPVFNEANLLERVHVWLDYPSEPPDTLDPTADAPSAVGVSNIDYDAKGQRKSIEYKNGASTAYDYDPLTFRLTRMSTTRAANLNGLASQLFQNNGTVQDLHYTYDPAGNITEISDLALKTVIHNQEQVDPVCRYVYDAIYRLIEGKGREHIGQSALLLNPPNGNYRDYPFAGGTQRSDPQAVRNYTEQYVYDPVGNFDRMVHQAANGAWTRRYDYQEASLIEPTKQSNRLSSTSIGAIPENYSSNGDGYDAHGNMLHMPHLQQMPWDYKNQLREVNLGGGGVAYYIYDASGQRVRKVCEKAPGLTEERIYLGGFEIFRRHGGAIGTDTPTLERETLHIMDDKQRIALVETRTLGNDPAPQQLIRYQFGNHLGSASLELDEQAQIISYEEYTPYGSPSYQAARSQTETAKRYRYTGKERDEESGLYYHGARYYAAWLGRWIRADPAELVDSPNLYLYTRANPIRYVDESGAFSKESFAETFKPLSAIKVSAPPKPGEPDQTLLQLREGQKIAHPGFVGSVAGQDKYLYTAHAGVVDIEHFFGSARFVYGRTVVESRSDAKATQLNLLERQEASNWTGGYAADDLPSNALGALFAEHLMSIKDKSKVDVAVEANKFFENLGAVDAKTLAKLQSDWSSSSFRSNNRARSAAPIPIVEQLVAVTGGNKSPYNDLKNKTGEQLLKEKGIELDPSISAATTKDEDPKPIALKWVGGKDILLPDEVKLPEKLPDTKKPP